MTRSVPLLLTCLFLNAFSAGAANISDPRLEEILNDYLSLHGGIYKIHDLSSLRIEGTLNSGETHVADVLIFQKRPNKVRLVMQNGPRKVTMGYNGEQCWVQQSINGKPIPGMELDETATANFIRESDMIDPLVNYRDTDYTYKLADEPTLNGTETYLIEVTRPGIIGSESYYLSQEDLKLIQKVTKVPHADGTTEEVVTTYSDYRPVNEIPMPYRTVTQVQDGEKQVLNVQSIVPNAGVFDYYFEEPK
ncbi:hypothetical protein H5P28_02085 [Ruficoccus amylovorans]|uniref:Outer membrane lipoprotein-sorting protein n=1 Tax=Ruficoccus amylovorans TaxID=1804625 RepID=A0A842H9Q1_9BACT|nr:hypothetical protein [Ruficoccus amylovorans]MBC2593040.1 hypothetical protein [Ruficoccus amylovorans]